MFCTTSSVPLFHLSYWTIVFIQMIDVFVVLVIRLILILDSSNTDLQLLSNRSLPGWMQLTVNFSKTELLVGLTCWWPLRWQSWLCFFVFIEHTHTLFSVTEYPLCCSRICELYCVLAYVNFKTPVCCVHYRHNDINSLYWNLPKSQVYRLQYIPNSCSCCCQSAQILSCRNYS